MFRCLCIFLCFSVFSPQLLAADAAPSVADIFEQAKPSVVVISLTGRDGERQGIGTGFIVSESGLVATNMHVVGEARPISVQLQDGTKLEVTAVHASDRNLDLAVLQVDPKDKKLTALELGDSDLLKEGEAVVVIGNPHGLKHSVVTGVASGRRDIDGRNMIQLAVPIEPGNSGGPVLDFHGRVHGIVTMKSALTDNLGFAVSVNTLKPLLEKPNSIPMARWLTIGTLDPAEWSTLFGAHWHQRAGHIFVDGAGEGFGGRSLCLFEKEQPAVPYELAVTVRMNDESGAAGLVFHADGADRHYGFYPSNGGLRLSCFKGPNVVSWQVLRDISSMHYRPGQWNDLKVRVEKDRIQCYVNDELVIESRDDTFTSGKVGLAKFRQTQAEFKNFAWGASLPSRQLDADVVREINAIVDALPDLDAVVAEHLQPLSETADASADVLRERAKALEEQAAHFRRLAADVHVHRVTQELRKVVEADEVDLIHAGLLIAKLDDSELNIDAYRDAVARMAAEIAKSLPEDAAAAEKLEGLRKYLFAENGFHGSRSQYYHRANSHLNRVIDDREGLPITLCVLYMELGKRLGLNIQGVGLPGHFVVKYVDTESDGQLIDVFDEGKTLSRKEAAELVVAFTGRALSDEDLEPAEDTEIVHRMLRNLYGLAERDAAQEDMLRYLEALVAVDPDDARHRGLRAVLRHQTGRRAAALEDLDWFLTEKPAGIDLDRIREMRDFFLHNPPH